MKLAGIICEYNPFHFGHKYQLDTVKKTFDGTVCVMSGSFVQRGDVAIFDKWTRAKAALLNGADLVLELPTKYVLSSAQGFATGGVRLLNSLGVINSLCFGAECESIEKLVNSAKIMLSEPRCVSTKIKEFLDSGMSFPRARALAFSEIVDEEILSMPNNILALEYIMALIRTNSSILPLSITRKAVGHHDTEEKDGFCSATYLREKIKNGEDILSLTPYDYKNEPIYDLDNLTSAFRYKLLTEKGDMFSGIQDMEDGLANRFLKAIEEPTISKMLDFVKTKRYTRTRLQRIVVSTLLELKGESENPEYVRILGMNKRGIEILAEIKKSCTLPIVNKVADFPEDLIKTDVRATNLAALCASGIPQNRDYTTSPVII